MAEDLSFTFDTDVFKRGINQVTKGMDSMKTTANTVAKGISKGFNKVIAKLGILKGAFAAIKSTLNNMPEIGKAFGIAKNVFMKNLLFPLRKEIMPLLQRMMDWVRDNRTLFVKWGQTLSGIFRFVVQGVKNILSVAKGLTEILMRSVNNIFGTTVDNITDLFNLVSFKFAAMIQFLTILFQPMAALIEPIITLVGKTLVGAFKIAVGFVEGFLTGLGNITEPIKGIVDALISIVDNLISANDEGDSLLTVWNSIGEIFGKMVGWIAEMTRSFIEGFGPAIRNIATPLQKIVDAFSSIFDSIFGSSEAMGGWREMFSGLGKFLGDVIVGAFNAISVALEGIAAFVAWITGNTPTGEPATAGDIFAGQSPEFQENPLAGVEALFGAKTAGNTNSVDVGGVTIITTATTEAEGVEVGAGFVQGMENQFNKEFEREGR